MQKAQFYLAGTLSLLMGGCTGQLYHGPAAPLDRPYDTGSGGVSSDEPGINYYPPLELLKTTSTQKFNKDSGCIKTTTYDIVTIADVYRPQRLYYHHGFLETYKFSAELNPDGTLKSVGTESTPDQGNTFKNVATGVASLATIPVGAGAKGATGPKVLSGEAAASKKAAAAAAAACPDASNSTFARFDPYRLPEQNLPSP